MKLSTRGRVATVNMTRGMSPRQAMAALVSSFHSFDRSASLQPWRASAAPAGLSSSLLPAGSFGLGVGCLWASPLHVRERVRGLSVPGTYLRAGTDTRLTGGMLGVDASINTLRVGLSVSAGAGDSRSVGDFDHAQSDLEYKGLTLYGGKLWNNFSLGGTLSYGRTRSKTRQTGLAGPLHTLIRNEALAGMARMEYSLDLGAWGTLTPYAGVEYLALRQPAARTDMAGVDVVTTSAASLRQWRTPVGFSWLRPFTTDSGLNVKPEIHAGYTPIFGKRRLSHTVRLAGSSSTAAIQGPALDRHTVNAGFALEINGKNLGFILGYDAQLSRHRTQHGDSTVSRALCAGRSEPGVRR